MAVKTVNVDLPDEIFDAEVNMPLIQQVVVAQQAAARQGTHDTKTRGEVRGGGRKPYRQKGTGRARQGSVRAPQFAGGATVHGPTPRSYMQRTPKKMKAAALRGALSDRARAGRVHVVDELVAGGTPSTKGAVAGLASISDHQRHLVVLERDDAVTWLSLRNVTDVHLLAVDQLNTYDVLLCDDVVFTRGAFETFAGQAAGEAVPAEPEAEAPAAAPVEDGGFPGSAEPLDNGEAPEGYEIKGNKDSLKYHAPGGRWYDSTVAEVWFRTAADAEAAGFVEAGKRAGADEEEAK